MDPIMRDKWISALRSGDYAQGTGELFQENGDEKQYCCLGVLLDIDGADWEYSGFEERYKDGRESAIHDGDLTESQRERFSLSRNDTHPLISMNDTGKPFSEIADYIEENF